MLRWQDFPTDDTERVVMPHRNETQDRPHGNNVISMNQCHLRYADVNHYLFALFCVLFHRAKHSEGKKTTSYRVVLSVQCPVYYETF